MTSTVSPLQEYELQFALTWCVHTGKLTKLSSSINSQLDVKDILEVAVKQKNDIKVLPIVAVGEKDHNMLRKFEKTRKLVSKMILKKVGKKY